MAPRVFDCRTFALSPRQANSASWVYYLDLSIAKVDPEVTTMSVVPPVMSVVPPVTPVVMTTVSIVPVTPVVAFSVIISTAWIIVGPVIVPPVRPVVVAPVSVIRPVIAMTEADVAAMMPYGDVNSCVGCFGLGNEQSQQERKGESNAT